MNLLASIKLAMTTLRANATRSFLTMLGISIGVGAVIALLAIGTGVQKYINDLFANAGTNLISIQPGRLQRGGGVPGTSASAVLTESDFRAITLNTPHLVGTTAAVLSIGNFSYGSATSQVQVLGVLPNFAQIRKWKEQRGRFIEDADNGGRLRVIVIGPTLEKDLFPNEESIGKTIKLNGTPFRVIGVSEAKGSTFAGDQDAIAFIPLTTAQERVFQAQFQSKTGEKIVSTIGVQGLSESFQEEIKESMRQTLRERHRLQPGDKDDFTIISQNELLTTFGAVIGVLTIFLGAIAGISLLVGGIGIMNIMLVSVTERTREIGLRKAIGAKRRTILTQFLIEAIVLSFLGGVIGIMLGGVIAFGIRLIPSIGFTPIVQASAIGLAVGFSIAVGLFFGIYPAFRASKLNPIDALRYE
jgi:putative ABC transport system permease protein